MCVNHKIVNFLDVTLDLSTRVYKPLMNPNNTIIYISRLSNHKVINKSLAKVDCFSL